MVASAITAVAAIAGLVAAAQVGVHPLVPLAVRRAAGVQRRVAAVVGGQLLLDDVRLDGHAEVIGLAGQVGLDMAINDRWFVNASAWIMDIDTDVHTAVGTIKTSIDPMAFMFGVGYRF